MKDTYEKVAQTYSCSFILQKIAQKNGWANVYLEKIPQTIRIVGVYRGHLKWLNVVLQKALQLYGQYQEWKISLELTIPHQCFLFYF